MAAAAARAGSGPWAAQKKQFPPALLSFFIYNPRFWPREGEDKVYSSLPQQCYSMYKEEMNNTEIKDESIRRQLSLSELQNIAECGLLRNLRT
ncbi:uncharacterized protein LOC129041054 isoform X3 [Pongo pygmaeus]|uniref:uncharacterized protein LOC129041054 isoform X3 n=1 Tax=Pongo pygmaeus TaxID=9600 RepID=UPI0023E1DE5E|nr:uncharacterized protein LOC129041054 isoform X5 [Pongo pygmaeus]XP_054415121.1 uncharacterized protein LOC129060280 isoform X4 [Pongo abelii]